MQPHPWFNPLHRRIITTLVCILWIVFEVLRDPSSMWTMISTGITVYAVWDFFLKGHYPVEENS